MKIPTGECAEAQKGMGVCTCKKKRDLNMFHPAIRD